MKPDDVSRVIMLLYGRMEHGGPFWCYVAVKPSRFEDFKTAERDGAIDLYDFDTYGEVVVSAEGAQPPDEVTRKVAEMYGADVGTFFEPIDPMAEISKKISRLKEEGEIPAVDPDNKPSPAAGSWAARVSRKGKG